MVCVQQVSLATLPSLSWSEDGLPRLYCQGVWLLAFVNSQCISLSLSHFARCSDKYTPVAGEEEAETCLM